MIRVAIACTAPFSIISCVPVSVYEKDLLTAKCTLVERMNVVQFVKSDEDFEIGVRCDDGSYHQVLGLMQSYEYAVLANPQESGAPSAIELVYCQKDGRDRIRHRLAQLNELEPMTGLVFSLRPSPTKCSEEVDGLSGLLTNSNSKHFDRQIK